MARPLRIEFAGALYHITARGNERRDIFFEDKDREAFVSTLAATCGRFNWLCHGYCLMSNHYHLLSRMSCAIGDLASTLSLDLYPFSHGVYE